MKIIMLNLKLFILLCMLSVFPPSFTYLSIPAPLRLTSITSASTSPASHLTSLSPALYVLPHFYQPCTSPFHLTQSSSPLLLRRFCTLHPPPSSICRSVNEVNFLRSFVTQYFFLLQVAAALLAVVKWVSTIE